MNKIYHLSSCSTCKRIINELGETTCDLIDVKQNHIDADTLDALAKEHGSYEILFNKRAIKYRQQGLNNKDLSNTEFRELILGEYTFLKRPIIIVDGQSFLGNSKKTVAAAKLALDV